ncbi:alpha/beta fold hydrolase [Pseudomonas typographi]|uniref:Alpha/beta fold hydrolase n=1 Tax=Pseudomonas typographi TaxID=2715964 RepID=A0ABR7YWG6_9PSED|nr:alpha/beta hydrolase [Pseudomonas typographi]MBD1585552.1 alpha/beta fold hydrolase [Pseudomonas typographi]MBD1597533.1 alpha/beta fold hydrolase [Pseudomonas typographi]
MQWIKVNGNALRYELGAKTGPTLVLIHEMGGTLESWDTVCANLGGRFQTLRYDVRGSGLSEKILGDTTIDDQAEDLHALLAALAIDGPIALAGIAVGAAIAIRFAARYPQRVSHLIGLSPACGVAPQARQATLERAAAIRHEGLRTLIPQLLDKTWPAALRSDPQAFERFALRWLGADPQSFAAIFSMLARMELEGDLPHVPTRTLLVAGEYDGLRPPAEIDRLAALASHIEAIHVASGHFMPVQSPQWVTTLFEQYILHNRAGREIYEAFISSPQHRVSPSDHAA